MDRALRDSFDGLPLVDIGVPKPIFPLFRSSSVAGTGSAQLFTFDDCLAHAWLYPANSGGSVAAVAQIEAGLPERPHLGGPTGLSEWSSWRLNAAHGLGGTIGQPVPSPVSHLNTCLAMTHAVARSLTDAEFTPAQADAITNAVRLPAKHGDHVTPDQFTAGLAEVRTEIAEVRTEIANLRTQQRTDIAGVRTEIANLETRLIR